MKLSFGENKGKEIKDISDKYLIWLVRKDRGDFPSREIGGDKFKIPADVVLEARKELKKRGFTFIGSRIE